MAARRSAGLLLHRTREGVPEVFLVHPGGPLWTRKDAGAWSVPKGECADGEDMLAAAIREFAEETGARIDGPFVPLTPVKQRSGKVVHAWAVAQDLDATGLASNTFTMEWPPRSGRMQSFPEVDRWEWFPLDEARIRINEGQRPLLHELATLLR